MITGFLSWWVRQMAGLVPARLARPDPMGLNAILADPDASDPEAPGALLLWLRRQGREQSAGRQEPGQAVLPQLLAEHPGLPLLLRLPHDKLLSREVSLPLAAEADYERVVQYEMDRLTPFSAEETFWSARVLRRHKDTGRLDLRLDLVPRAWLAAPLQTLSETAGRLVGIEVRHSGVPAQAAEAAAAPPAEPLRIAIAGAAPARTRLRQQRQLAAIGVLCAVLALAAILLPFARQSAALARADRQIAQLQPQVRAALALRAKLQAGSAGADVIEAGRTHLGDPLGLLASLTRVLPDDTYLTDLTLRDGILTVTGQSAGAVRLIGLLSADPAFNAPAFSAPVTRIEASNADLFSIRAQVAAPAADKTGLPGAVR